MYMAWREIHHNFFVDNFSQQENVDNDDGSGYYRTHHNFLVYGSTGLKNDYAGHVSKPYALHFLTFAQDNWHYENIYAYLIQPLADGTQQKPHHEDRFYGNRVVMQASNVGYFICNGPGKTVLHSNKYYTADGDLRECGHHLSEWQQMGEDANSTVARHPAPPQIIQWAESLLGF